MQFTHLNLANRCVYSNIELCSIGEIHDSDSDGGFKLGRSEELLKINTLVDFPPLYYEDI